MKSAAEKMRIRPGARSYLAGAPATRLDEMGHRGLTVQDSLAGEFDYLHLFTTKAADLDDQFPRLAAHLAAGGAFWVSWPKAGQLDTDLTLPRVIEIGYSHGLVESTTIGVDQVWSAIKFTHPKPGKTYHNSYGQLPDGV